MKIECPNCKGLGVTYKSKRSAFPNEKCKRCNGTGIVIATNAEKLQRAKSVPALLDILVPVCAEFVSAGYDLDAGHNGNDYIWAMVEDNLLRWLKSESEYEESCRPQILGRWRSK